jgi:hypothetical protein
MPTFSARSAPARSDAIRRLVEIGLPETNRRLRRADAVLLAVAACLFRCFCHDVLLEFPTRTLPRKFRFTEQGVQ